MPVEPRTVSAARRGLFALLALGIPAGWLLAIGFVGRRLEPSVALYATVAMFALTFVGVPLVVAALGRRLLSAGRLPAPDLRVRMPSRHQLRPPRPLPAPAPPGPHVSAGRHALAVPLLALMLALSVALWTAIPLGWLWIGSQLAATSGPAMVPYLVVIAGIPCTAAAVMGVLAHLDALHAALMKRGRRADARPAWQRSLRDGRERAPWSTLDLVMALSVVIAVITLATWFFLFADQQSVFQQYTN